jgi:hypothetical protein
MTSNLSAALMRNYRYSPQALKFSVITLLTFYLVEIINTMVTINVSKQRQSSKLKNQRSDHPASSIRVWKTGLSKAILVTPRIIDNVESISDDKYLCEFKTKIGKVFSIWVRNPVRTDLYKKYKNLFHWYVPLKQKGIRVPGFTSYIYKNI